MRPGDVVLLHDPQTAGLIPAVADAGALAVWRCHIAHDETNSETERGWSFLAPYLGKAHAFVFSRRSYVPSFCDNGRSAVIAPAIDPFSTKNRPMPPESIEEILCGAGMVSRGGNGARPKYFSAKEQKHRKIVRAVTLVTADSPPSPHVPLVVQVSRWDALKDPVGVIAGFANLINAGHPTGAHLILAGPEVRAVADDPEGATVLRQVLDAWQSLSDGVRHRIHLALLPMEDLEENAAIVNAIQRHATVVVQKSLQEGFGLTVTEAMWKGRPVVASAVGGIRDQIVDGVHGLLLRDPTDVGGFSRILATLLENPEKGKDLGEKAHLRVREEFLGIRSLSQYAELLLGLLDGSRPTHRARP